MGVIGAHELLAAVSGPEKTKRLWVLAGVLAVLTVFATYAGREEYKGTVLAAAPWLLCAAAALLFLLAVRWYGRENAVAFQDICAVLLGGVAIPLAMSCLLRLRLLNYGGGLVLMPLVAAFMSDSAALFTGMACGKHKLASKASPKKTVEGAVGGLVGGVLGMIVFRIVFFFVTLQPLFHHGKPLAMTICIRTIYIVVIVFPVASPCIIGWVDVDTIYLSGIEVLQQL